MNITMVMTVMTNMIARKVMTMMVIIMIMMIYVVRMMMMSLVMTEMIIMVIVTMMIAGAGEIPFAEHAGDERCADPLHPHLLHGPGVHH
jgi:hypothetical protein